MKKLNTKPGQEVVLPRAMWGGLAASSPRCSGNKQEMPEGQPPSLSLGSLEGGTLLAQLCGRGHRRGEHRALEEAPQGKPCWGRRSHPQLQHRSPCTPTANGAVPMCSIPLVLGDTCLLF